MNYKLKEFRVQILQMSTLVSSPSHSGGRYSTFKVIDKFTLRHRNQVRTRRVCTKL